MFFSFCLFTLEGLHQLLDRFRNFVRIRRYRSADRKLKHMEQTNYYRVQSWLEKNCVQTADDQLTSRKAECNMKGGKVKSTNDQRRHSLFNKD